MSRSLGADTESSSSSAAGGGQLGAAAALAGDVSSAMLSSSESDQFRSRRSTPDTEEAGVGRGLAGSSAPATEEAGVGRGARGGRTLGRSGGWLASAGGFWGGWGGSNLRGGGCRIGFHHLTAGRLPSGQAAIQVVDSGETEFFHEVAGFGAASA